MNSVRAVRLVGLLEGISLLALLLIAMPLKYIFQYPIAVRITGSVHGLLFLCFLAMLLRAHFDRNWRARTSLALLAAAVLPFGFLFVDRLLQRELDSPRAA